MDSLNTKIKNILTEKTLKVRPENIKNGVSILGITGNVVELNGETKTITPSTSQQIITPSSGKNAITQATVTAVDSTIDNNIQAENIKKNVNILGVTGTLEEGITPTGTINITENGTVDVTNYASASVDVQGGGGADLSEYFNNTLGTGQDSYSGLGYLVKTIPVDTKVSGDSLIRAFQYTGIETIPLIDTKYVEIMSYMCRYCTYLKNIPVLNTQRVYVMANTFQGCNRLTDESLNNIMEMCINSAITSNKKLSYIGLNSTQIAKCKTLSNYQAFLDAGWTAT